MPHHLRHNRAALVALALLCVAPPAAPAQRVVVIESPYSGLGNLLIRIQQAALIREDVRQKKLVTRRKTLEQYDWDRKFILESYEIERGRVREAEKDRARFDPPEGEVASGKALNDLLTAFQTSLLSASPGSSGPLESDTLKNINLSSSRYGGNVGMLRVEELAWPYFLRQKRFEAARSQADRAVAELRKTLAAGRPGDEEVAQLEQSVDAMYAELKAANRAGQVDFLKFNTSSKFLDELRGGVGVLHKEQGEAKVYLKALECSTVAELVQYMKANGLSFSAATQGRERHYRTLHRSIADEYNRLKGTTLRAVESDKPLAPPN